MNGECHTKMPNSENKLLINNSEKLQESHFLKNFFINCPMIVGSVLLLFVFFLIGAGETSPPHKSAILVTT